jgi:sigma-B regulation protein RsbU (phosphoserine phosphatase)
MPIRTNQTNTLSRESFRLLTALGAENAELERFHSDLEVARAMHERIFPTERPDVPGFDYYGDCRPARGVRGDYLDYFEMNNGNLGFAIGEVCGEGVPAALLSSSLHSIIRALRFVPHSSLTGLVRTVDELFNEIRPDDCYATLFVGEYDPVSCQLRYVNAGHEPPFIVRRSGGHHQTTFLESGGPVIGMMKELPYRERVTTLAPKDLLVAYTDGLCDTTSPDGEEWGWPRFLDTVVESSSTRARDIVESVMQEADAFAHGVPQGDDVTLWVGRVRDAAMHEPLRKAECVADAVGA